ncbi:RNA polymerase sigma factor [Dyadobacter arcticus]|uniref:RNA polymerase sigma-70 factor (ECF subfamily) n=1 Tax=Dyadobacter arcticus TaxID=1078754 RepID=A0ABX0UE54_9BACT|nr:sigma-70 family RNA polymerase sigma factor [Dyadobacter arcticus]NIJ51278.1 RNA polymerase sigma-70 factor (ECF subfamily) [Dyadobacter arcticus]
MACPDESIIRKVMQGDESAFAELYNYYKTPALRFTVSLLKDEEEAENMVQDVFIKIWVKRAQIKPDYNFNSYLFTCLRNMAFDHFKRIEKSEQLRRYYMEAIRAAAEEEREESERRLGLVLAAVDSLSIKRKLILKLNIEEGKSYQEIAESLRISKNTVKNQLVKAKQILRDKVDFAMV